MSKGVLFKYKDKDGTQRKCAAYNEDQTNALLENGKLVVTKLDDSYEPIIENGEPVKIIKSMCYLVQIGFID
jgi:hypothetical protein